MAETTTRHWMIWVCGCEGKVETTDWAYDDGADEPTICGRCKEPHREIEVVGAAEDWVRLSDHEAALKACRREAASEAPERPDSASQSGNEHVDDAEESNPYVCSPVVESAIERLEELEQQAKAALAEHRKKRDPMGTTQGSLVRYTEARIYRDAIQVLADADYERHVLTLPDVAKALEESNRTIEEWRASLSADDLARCCGRDDGKHEPFCDVGNYEHPLVAERDRFKAQHDALYLAVRGEIDRLRGKSEANRSMVHWAHADRLQEILDQAGEKREVPDYGEAKSAQGPRTSPATSGRPRQTPVGRLRVRSGRTRRGGLPCRLGPWLRDGFPHGGSRSLLGRSLDQRESPARRRPFPLRRGISGPVSTRRRD